MAWGTCARAGLAAALIMVLIPPPSEAASAARARTTRTLPSRGGALFVSVARARALVDFYAVRHGVPLHVARNLVQTESSWRQNAVSPVGARGLMQLMPSTARGLGVNVHDTEQNVEGGMRYLSKLYGRFGRWDLALAAYNTGPTRVRRYGGVPPWTRSYVRRILHRPAVVAGPRFRAIQKFLALFPAGVRRSKGV